MQPYRISFELYQKMDKTGRVWTNVPYLQEGIYKEMKCKIQNIIILDERIIIKGAI